MAELRDALLRLIKAGRKVKKLQESYLDVGLDDNKVFEIFGDIIDAIYALTGEHTDVVEKSSAYVALTAPGLDDEHRVKVLMAEYKKNHPDQPAPQFTSREQRSEQFRKNGGYIYETPEGDWT